MKDFYTTQWNLDLRKILGVAKIFLNIASGSYSRYLGEGTFIFTFYVVNLPLGKFGPHPGGNYGGRGGLSFSVEGKGR